MDIPFVGKECEVPIFSDVHNFRVGVFAGNLHTTTSAYVPAKKSILCGTGDKPIVPKEDAYDKMMEDINADAVRAETAANKAEEKLADMQERYYTPSVNESGDLSWEANDEGMPEVPMVNIKGQKGDKGDPGEDGYSPTVGVSTIDGGHRVRFVDKNGAVAMNVMNGQDGQDGVSPNVTVQPITGGNRVTITDANGTKTFDVMNGEQGEPGVNAENDELFIVRYRAGSADKTYREIMVAAEEKRALLLIETISGEVYPYAGRTTEGCRFAKIFANGVLNETKENCFTVSSSDKWSHTTKIVNARNPYPIRLTGAVNAEYDGSTPVTVNIPEGGEGGGSGLPTGGEPHQMLVTDAEGKAKWEERTHYSESEQGIVFVETTPIAMGSGQFAVMEPIVNQPTAGNVYTIVPSGGESIESEAFGVELDGVYMVCIGNPLFVGGENNDLPLAMAFFPESMVDAFDGVTAMIVTNGSYNIPALSVVGTVEKIHKIDPKYLPTMGASFLVNGSALGSVMNLGADVEDETYTMGQFAFALGGRAQGYMSFAVGESANAEGDKSFAQNGLASGDASFVANGATAKGGGAFAANSSTANGVCSASFGQGEANGDYSFAEGVYTVANARAQHVQGRYNIKDTAYKYAHIVGNGTLGSNRSNAHTIDWNGTAWFAGVVKVGGTGQDDVTAKELATKEYVENYIEQTLLGGAW